MLDNSQVELTDLDRGDSNAHLRNLNVSVSRADKIESLHFCITFERADRLIRNFQIELFDVEGHEIGRLQFPALMLDESRKVVEELLGLGKCKLPFDLDPTLKAIELLHSCLKLCEEREIAFTSKLGIGAGEIAAEFADQATQGQSVEHHRNLLRVQEVAQGIFHVSAPTNYQLASTFLRFQEYFESPNFRGKVFDLPEYKRWYASQSETENFSYYQDWGGFNLPDYILEPFQNGDFGALSAREEALLSYFKEIPRPFYIIGTSDDCASLQSTVRHELGHALFYLNQNYREEVRAILASVPTRKIENYLRRKGYHENSIEDETHAYLLESVSFLKSELGLQVSRYAPIHQKLIRVFNKHFAGNAS